MSRENELLKKYGLRVKHISYKKSLKIVDTNKGKFTVKVKENNNDIYDYLLNREFKNFIPPVNSQEESFEIYPYISEKSISAEDKAVNLVYILSMLHTRTTVYEVLDLDNVKKIYEENLKELNYLEGYYHDLQDYIENIVYMSPDEYLLIRNISRIYNAIIYSKNTLEAWYQKEILQTKERQVLLHNNLSLDHFLISGDNNYLINWKNAKKGLPIYDLLNFFKNEYESIELEGLYRLYQSKYKYTEEETLLFNALLSKPWKLEFSNNHYQNTIKVQKLIDYLAKGSILVSKENKKYQEAQQ